MPQQCQPGEGQPNIELIKSAFEQLFQMVRKQDDLIHSWTKFFLSIQAGLAVALSFLLKLAPSGNRLANAGSVIIPVLGIATAIVLTAIIVREHFWQGRYIVQITKLPMKLELYRSDWVPGEPDPEKCGCIAKRFCWLRNALIIGWFIWLLVSIY